MDALFVMALLGLVAWWLYKRGKRIGSIKAYGVGLRRGRRSRRRGRS